MNLRATDLATTITAAVAAATIGFVQPTLGAQLNGARLRDDVFVLPPPRQLEAMTLGYRHAAADLLWAKLLVEQGLHMQEKRKFTTLPAYIDAIIALEPDHPTLYQFVDTLIVFQPVPAGPEEARLARRYLERGTQERPYDPELWLHYGQFVAFLAPAMLNDNAEIEQWRADGARALMHAVELGADADRSLAASTILSEAGHTKATIQHLQRAYALTDDPETRRQIAFKLQRLRGGVNSELSEIGVSLIEHEWRTRYPFLSRGASLLIGPYRPPAACAGPDAHARRECPHDWTSVTSEGR